MRSLEVLSPAKINLYLDVLGKRPDGYHELLTVFERVSLADRIRLAITGSGPITVASASRDIPCDERNLAYKAAALIREEHGIKNGIKILIRKKIPVGGGLGGGSSNAASVLMALNTLLGLRLSRGKLIDYANRLGSDVAFFILDKPFALGEGRGGDLTPIKASPAVTWWHLLFVAPIPVFTRDVYAGLKTGKIYKLTKKPSDVNMLFRCLKNGDFAGLDRLLYNRLCEVVYKSTTLVSELRSDLLKFGLTRVHMSGSGPTLFSNYPSERLARSAAAKVRRRFSDRCRIILTRTL